MSQAQSPTSPPPLRRTERKQRTRERLLESARVLFAKHGYATTTLRAIAAHAGVSVGSVFTTFDSKEDILFAIASEGYDSLAAAIEREATGEDAVRERLKRGFCVAYAFEYPRLSLLMAQLGASWTWSHDFELKSQKRLAKPFGFIGRLVAEAIARGEIRAGAGPEVIADLLLGVYLRNFRHAWYRGLSVEAVSKMANVQIDLLFDGFCAPRTLTEQRLLVARCSQRIGPRLH